MWDKANKINLKKIQLKPQRETLHIVNLGGGEFYYKEKKRGKEILS